MDTKAELKRAKDIVRKAIAMDQGEEKQRLLKEAADIRAAVDQAIANGDAQPLSKDEAFGMMAD